MTAPPPGIAVLDSITHATAEQHAGRVVIAASHGGLVAAQIGRASGARAIVLNNAGVGFEEAGVSGLSFLQAQGCPAAAADHRSCRIGDGQDLFGAGIVAQLNALAEEAGVRAGMPVSEAAELFAALPAADLPPYTLDVGEHLSTIETGGRRVVLMDSASLLRPGHREDVAVTGSHGALLGGEGSDAPALKYPVHAAFFNDAGLGKETAGIGRLARLARDGTIAGAVDAMTAPIGDARRSYELGILPALNALAEARGLRIGQPLKEAVDALCKSS